MSTQYSLCQDRVAYSGDGDQLVLLDVTTSEYLSVNGAAAVIWTTLIAGPASVEKLAAQLAESFGIAADTARQDAAEFVELLVGRGFITDDSGPEPSG